MWIAATILGCLIIFLQKGIGDSFRLYFVYVLLLSFYVCAYIVRIQDYI